MQGHNNEMKHQKAFGIVLAVGFAAMDAYAALIADVKASSVYQALPDEKKSYDLPNVLLVDNGISVRKTELTEAVGRTLPWSYDGLI